MKNIFLIIIALMFIFFSCQKEKRTIIPELCGTWKLDSLTAENISHSQGSGYQNVRRKLTASEIIYLELKENGDYKITRNNIIEEKGFIKWEEVIEMRESKVKSDYESSSTATVYYYTSSNKALFKKNILKKGTFIKSSMARFGIVDILYNQKLYISKGISFSPIETNTTNTFKIYYGVRLS